MKELLQKLVQTDSTAAVGEIAAAQVLADYLHVSQIDCRIDTWDNRHANCYAHAQGICERKALLFLCHLDVVPPGDTPWQHPPFSGLEIDGHIYGRGATDMKGGTVAAAVALQQIVAAGTPLPGDVILAATAGEETDSCGVERLMVNRDWLPQLAGIIIPEPTDFDLVSAHRGLLWLEIRTQGKTAHSSMPHLGVNAITSMFMAMNVLKHLPLDITPHPQLGSCSMSLNTIQGGKALNVVPDQCTLGMDIRILPGQDPQDIIRDIETLLKEQHQRAPQFEASVSLKRCVGALETDTDHPFVRHVCDLVGIPETQAVGFTTDAPSVVPLDAPILIFGPGKGRVCHQPDESIALADVERAVNIYQKLMLASFT
ncbi:M20 family metallopeptidase [Planctomycetota bacterium]